MLKQILGLFSFDFLSVLRTPECEVDDFNGKDFYLIVGIAIIILGTGFLVWYAAVSKCVGQIYNRRRIQDSIVAVGIHLIFINMYATMFEYILLNLLDCTTGSTLRLDTSIS